MVNSLKSEFRKLITIRSTYVMAALSLLFVLLVSFYVEGLRTDSYVENVNKLSSQVSGSLSAIAVFGVITGILLFAHEYNYNTITYTLTASRSRTTTLLSKILVMSGYAVVFALVFGALAPLLALLGMYIQGVSMVPQQFPYLALLWRSIFYTWAYIMMGLALVTVIRHQIGAIVSIFLVPTAELLLAAFLGPTNARYLPFSALADILEQNHLGLDPVRAAIVVLIYLALAWLIAWQLFLRRDAN